MNTRADVPFSEPNSPIEDREVDELLTAAAKRYFLGESQDKFVQAAHAIGKIMAGAKNAYNAQYPFVEDKDFDRELAIFLERVMRDNARNKGFREGIDYLDEEIIQNGFDKETRREDLTGELEKMLVLAVPVIGDMRQAAAEFGLVDGVKLGNHTLNAGTEDLLKRFRQSGMVGSAVKTFLKFADPEGYAQVTAFGEALHDELKPGIRTVQELQKLTRMKACRAVLSAASRDYLLRKRKAKV